MEDAPVEVLAYCAIVGVPDPAAAYRQEPILLLKDHTPTPRVENRIWYSCAGARGNIRLATHGRLCHEDFSHTAQKATNT